MADSRGDAPGKSRGTATGDKPERPNARGRNRQTGASSDQSASASTTMSANVGALLRLCERVLPQEVCAAASCGSHRLPSLAAMSDRYRDHLREKHVAASDALALPRNALPMSRQGELREGGKAIARRRGQVADLGLSDHTVGARKLAHSGRRERFATIEKAAVGLSRLPRAIQSRPGLTATGGTDGGGEGAPVATAPVFVFIFTCSTSS